MGTGGQIKLNKGANRPCNKIPYKTNRREGRLFKSAKSINLGKKVSPKSLVGIAVASNISAMKACHAERGCRQHASVVLPTILTAVAFRLESGREFCASKS